MTVTLRPATDGELAAYLEHAAGEYASERVRSGDDREDARRHAEETLAELFPGGRPAHPHLVFRVEVDGEGAGVLWIGPREAARPDRWWVWDVLIDDAFRGRGAGRRTMELAEEQARAHGATEIGLNVFGHNHVASGLYRSLGYQVTTMQMRKDL